MSERICTCEVHHCRGGGALCSWRVFFKSSVNPFHKSAGHFSPPKIIDVDQIPCISKNCRYDLFGRQSHLELFGADSPEDTHCANNYFFSVYCGECTVMRLCKNCFQLRLNNDKHSFKVAKQLISQSRTTNADLISYPSNH